MKDDYLWDRSGPPDPDIERLEKLLGSLRYDVAAESLPPPIERSNRFHRWPAGIAAAVLIAVSLWQFRFAPEGVRASWSVASVEGAPRSGRRELRASASLFKGQVIRTDDASAVRLYSGSVGQVELAPRSELRVLESGSQERLQLKLGLLHAYIWAPPQKFVVETPYARAIDLGCEYTLQVNPDGTGLLEVVTGWVAFQFRDRESFIPAGAACVTRQNDGPGTPYFRDASEEFRAALRRFDETNDKNALAIALKEARAQDGLSLWHLLSRTRDSDRPAVFERFAELVPLPPELNPESVLRRDRKMLDLCWNALQLDSAEWFREWKRHW